MNSIKPWLRVFGYTSMLVSSAVWAQTTYDKDRVVKGNIPTISDVARKKVDVTGFWFYIRQGRLDAARAELNRLRSLSPTWQPDNEMLAALQPQTVAPSSTQETAENRYLTEMGRLSRLTDAELAKLNDKRLDNAKAAIIEGRDAAHGFMLAWLYLRRQQPALALTLFERVHGWQSGLDVTDGMLAALVELAQRAKVQKDISALVRLDTKARQWEENELGVSIAWQFYEQQDYAPAYALFVALPQTSQTLSGQALVLWQQGHKEKATALACKQPGSSTLLDLCRNGLAEQINQAFEREQYTQVTQLAEASLQLGQDVPLLGQDQQVLLAWSHFHLHHNEAAARLFADLLTQTQEPQYAEALVMTLDSKQAREHYTQRFSEVKTLLQHQQAQQALSRKQFDRAYRLEQPRFLQHRDRIMLTWANEGERRSGVTGLGNLDSWSSLLSLSALWGEWRWWGALEFDHHHSGLPAQSEDFGSGEPGEADPFPALSTIKGGAISIGFRLEQEDASWFGYVRQDLSNRIAGDTFSGRLSGLWFSSNWSHRAAIFHEPLSDSLLTRTGARNPATNGRFGGVSETGIEWQGSYNYAPDWSLSTTLRAGHQQGDEVSSNKGIFIRQDWNYDFSKQVQNIELDYWRLGPFLSWRAHERNLSGFTLGHGGYFSPTRQWRAGGYTALLTAEAKSWQIRASASIAYSDIFSASEPRFPLSHSEDLRDEENSRGINGDITVEAQWLITPHLQLEGYVSRTTATGFVGSRAGIWIRAFWHPRRSVVSRELPLAP